MDDLAAQLLDDEQEGQPGRIVYGVATALNTVAVRGAATPITMPALTPVVTGDYCAVWESGADRLILGPVERDATFGIFDDDGSAIPTGSSTAVTFEAIHDPANWLSGGNAVPTISGWYRVTLSVVWPNTTTNRFLAAIRKNGTDISTGISNVAGPVAGNPTNQIATAVFLNGTDAVDARVLHAVGSNQTPTILLTLQLLG